MSSFSGHTKKVNDVHCDNNQVLIVSSSDDGTIKLWDSRIGKDFRTLRVHTGDAVLCAKMRSTGRDNILVVCPTTTTTKKKITYLLQQSGSNTGQVAVWDMHAPYCITTYTQSTRHPVCDVDFDNANNIVFAAHADGTCTVFETNAWTPCHHWRVREVGCNSMVFAQYPLLLFFSFLSHFSLFIFGFDEHRHSVVTGFVDGAVLVSKISHES